MQLWSLAFGANSLLDIPSVDVCPFFLSKLILLIHSPPHQLFFFFFFFFF